MQQENRERQVEASNGSSYLVIALNTQSRRLKHRANGRNIVGQQLPTLLYVTRCVRLYTLLHVVGCCCVLFETGRAFSYVQCTNGLNHLQQCWESLANSVASVCNVSVLILMGGLMGWGARFFACRAFLLPFYPLFLIFSSFLLFLPHKINYSW